MRLCGYVAAFGLLASVSAVAETRQELDELGKRIEALISEAAASPLTAEQLTATVGSLSSKRAQLERCGGFFGALWTVKNQATVEPRDPFLRGALQEFDRHSLEGATYGIVFRLAFPNWRFGDPLNRSERDAAMMRELPKVARMGTRFIATAMAVSAPDINRLNKPEVFRVFELDARSCADIGLEALRLLVLSEEQALNANEYLSGKEIHDQQSR